MAETDAVDRALGRCPRSRFLPPEQLASAHLDIPLTIGHGQTNSQPRTVVAMLRLLDVRAGDRVLDVGSGSGWTTALLGELVGPAGSVHGVERVPELVERSRAALAEDPRTWVRIHRARAGVLGLPRHAPFDRILVSAEADELPSALVEQLGPGGVMVAPVAGVMLRAVRDRDGDGVRVSRHGHYRFVPLVED